MSTTKQQLGDLVAIMRAEAAKAELALARGMTRWVMQMHAPEPVEEVEGGMVAVCRWCRPVREWPCDEFGRADRRMGELAGDATSRGGPDGM